MINEGHKAYLTPPPPGGFNPTDLQKHSAESLLAQLERLHQQFINDIFNLTNRNGLIIRRKQHFQRLYQLVKHYGYRQQDLIEVHATLTSVALPELIDHHLVQRFGFFGAFELREFGLTNMLGEVSSQLGDKLLLSLFVGLDQLG